MKFFLFFILSICAFSGCSQDYLLDQYETTYFHQRKEYTWKELGVVYMEHEESFDLYSRGRDNLSSARTFGIGGSAPVGLGVGMIILLPEQYGKVYGTIVLASGIIVEIAALIHYLKGKRKLSKAKEEFNFEMLKRYGYKSGLSLSFGGGQNGVGLILEFGL